MHPLGDSSTRCFALGLQVNNLRNCEKSKREKEGKGENDKGKNLGTHLQN
jgi:hypothetical protein